LILQLTDAFTFEPMNSTTYEARRNQIEHYFDRTAAKAWALLTSNEPVGHIRTTVREGRDQMRATLMSWLPQDMHGMRLLDAGCGTGALAVLAAARGAEVLAIDLSPTLVNLARERIVQDLPNMPGSIEFLSGDMLDPKLGSFDYVVGMDSLIHYGAEDILRALAVLSQRTRRAMLFTFAPRTPLLALARSMGQLFPKTDRSPSLVPVAQQHLLRLMKQTPELEHWTPERTVRVSRGFYTSQAWEWRHT
jgi:magnesium-protoporphyrin O-methyltransferase